MDGKVILLLCLPAATDLWGWGGKGSRRLRVWWSSWKKHGCQQGATKFTGQVHRKEPPRARTVTWPSVSEGLERRRNTVRCLKNRIEVGREGVWVKLFRERGKDTDIYE